MVCFPSLFGIITSVCIHSITDLTADFNHTHNDTEVLKYYDPDKSLENNFDSYTEFAMYYFPKALSFDRYFTIVLCIIGFPGNIISFLIWSKRRMYRDNSSAIYLAALSINDTVVLAIALFRNLTKSWGISYEPTPGSCEILETINITTQYSAAIFVLGFTVERWLAICQPFLVRGAKSVRRNVLICVGITVVTLIVCSPEIYFHYTSKHLSCETRPESFYFTSTLEVLYSLLAPLLVLVFNCLVIRELSKIRATMKKTQFSNNKRKVNSKSNETSSLIVKSRNIGRKRGKSLSRLDEDATEIDQLTRQSDLLDRRKTLRRMNTIETFSPLREQKSALSHSPKFVSTTIMLLVVSFFVIFATLLGGLMYLLETKMPIDTYATWTMREFENSTKAQTILKLRTMKTVLDEFSLSHFAMGFILYYSTGRNFRKAVRRFFKFPAVGKKEDKVTTSTLFARSKSLQLSSNRDSTLLTTVENTPQPKRNQPHTGHMSRLRYKRRAGFKTRHLSKDRFTACKSPRRRMPSRIRKTSLLTD